ncbi:MULTISPECIES: hypothetical protein [Microbacterium]|uniref:hypothetical protein n=1 Tax=Microbacterium TaxID=33882 RepID=UPI000F5DCF37|nr:MULTISPECIES: hypothetical protein [Microbacterium]AZH79160.1 hypothetical protein CSX12_12240 [Microbacterium sp. Y-01]MBM7465005.1 hypothetical protein [Microbacterium esteraromaticum]
MSAEATQEKGRRGVAHTKRWLEATTFVELQFNAYEDEGMCELELLSGTKVFDMYGSMLGPNRRPVYVENKDDTNVSRLYSAYQEFLANAYSATARRIQVAKDQKAEFMWVSTHPFNQAGWGKLATPDEVKTALGKYPGVLGATTVDDELLRTVASRIWVLVMNHRQLDISLTHEEVQLVMGPLKRKVPTL